VARVPIADLYPELVAGMPEARRERAREELRAPVETLQVGPWITPNDVSAGVGILVLEGLLMRDVVLAETTATEIVGRGDILQPAQHDGSGAPVPFDVEWRAMQPTTLAHLDRAFAAALAPWPEAVEAIVSAAVRRSMSLALQLAVGHMRRVHTRILVLMWHMADRWGRVGPEGVHVPLKMSHRALGQLVGAQRPSVTTALRHLAAEGRVSRRDDGTWMLHGDPPETLERLRAAS
jgi:CRP/FNR family transcriptional regulator, cyclic AMP receptor protein